jgi:pyrroline-5-carboxylate reductase
VNKKFDIVIIGSGHAALALALAFKKKQNLVQVVARNANKAKQIALRGGCKNYGKIESVKPGADFYIICVKDRAISEVAKKIPLGGIVVHLSGATSIKTLSVHKNAAVAWPVRSLAGLKPAAWKHVHILYEAGNTATRKKTLALFGSLKSTLHYTNSQNRLDVHTTVVILNNFIHHLAYRGHTRLKKYGLDKALFKQIITDTFEKVLTSDLKSAQTGPARRNEKSVIKAQQRLLKNDKELYNVYKYITKSIIKNYYHE